MKISVIIPCFNCEKYINECLKSVLESILPEDEVICVNDGSTDHTLKLIQSIFDSRIRIITQMNKGPGAARNTGIDAAKGDLILFVDADDVISPSLITILKLQPKKIIFGCQVCLQLTKERNKLESILPEQIMELNTQMVLSAEEVKLSILNADCQTAKRIYRNSYEICGPVAKAYCREILEAYDIRFPEDLRWGEDICFNLKYLSHIRGVCFFPVKAYWYRTVQDSLINRYYPKKSQEILYFVQTVHEILKVGERKTEEREAFNFLAVKQYLYILQFDLCNCYNTEPFMVRKQRAWELKENNALIRNGIDYCQGKTSNISINFVIFLLNMKWFGVTDFIMKLYNRIKRAER